MEGPPANDLCSVCYEGFNIPFQANCSHWFCGNCILQVWQHGSALWLCKCPLCRPQITLLVPAEASQRQCNDPGVSEMVGRVEQYNCLFGRRDNSLFQTSLRELTTLGIKNVENLAIPSVRNDAAFLFTVVGTAGFLGVLAGQLPGVSVAYLFGVPILGYSLDIGKEHDNLIDERLEKLIYSGQLDTKELDSMLVLRQTLLSDNMLTTLAGMENMVSSCIKQLSKLLDTIEDVGISEIVGMISSFLDSNNHTLNPEKLQARKEVMANMLAKSLQAGDAIFSRVSHTVYLAPRGIVLGGNRLKGRQLAEAALQCIGASLLTENMVEALEMLIVVATVLSSVHGAWYKESVKNL